jgi:protein SCO1
MRSRQTIGSLLPWLAPLVLVLPLVMTAGCRKPAAGQAATKTYAFKGVVIAKSPDSELSVTNENIPGFMGPMTMNYRVKDPAGYKAAQVGDSIGAELVVTADVTDYWLQNVKVLRAVRPGQPPLDLSPKPLDFGRQVPDVPLVNQDGKVIRLSDFRGRVVLLTFIYTRCPLPNYCPLMTSHFAEIQRDLERDPQAWNRTHLLTISIDPAYDTPPVLRKYGLAYMDTASGFAHWDFATPSAANLKKLADVFGLYYEKQGNQIVHSMDTVLVSPEGTVVNSWPDNRWQVKDVLAALETAAKAPVAGRKESSR